MVVLVTCAPDSNYHVFQPRCFQLFSDLGDEDINTSIQRVMCTTVQRLNQLISIHHPAFRFGQREQQPELVRGQRYRFAENGGRLIRVDIEFDTAVTHNMR